MHITSLGHDGLRVESTDGSTALLINPWLDPAGAFAGTWLSWPDNSSVRESAALADVTAVVITSARPDHLCAWTLAQLPADVPVIIPQLPAPGLELAVERAAPGRPLTTVAEWASHTVGSFAVTLVSDSDTNPECAVVVEGDDQLMVDLNRARVKALPLRTIRQLAGDREVPDFVSVRAVPANGAAWGAEWPTADKRAAALRRERLRGVEYAVQALRVLQPELAVPMAGSPALADAEADAELVTELVQTPEHLLQLLAKRMVNGLLPMNPGDRVDLAVYPELPDAPEADVQLPDPDRGDAVAALVESRRDALDASALPAADASLRDTFAAYFSRLHDAPGVSQSLDLCVGFDVSGPHGGQWAVDLRADPSDTDPLDMAARLDECDYVIRVPDAFLQATLTGRLSWDALVGSLQLRIARGPSNSKDHPLTLLFHAMPAPEDAFSNLQRTLAATRTVRLPSASGVLEFERYCPHSELDLLQTGELVDGASFIRCIAHHYEFDLATGKCRNADCRPLRLGPEA